jgi:hypothetical protein
VLDPDEEAYRLGYGDREGLELLQRVAKDNHIGLRSQPGLRIGLLIADEDLLIWSPTAAAAEADRSDEQPNGLELSGSPLEGMIVSNSLVDQIRTAQEKLRDIDIEATVLEGIRKLRVTDPSGKLVFKEISWESPRLAPRGLTRPWGLPRGRLPIRPDSANAAVAKTVL